MRRYAMVCANCGAEYSADAADYFWAKAKQVFYCMSCGWPGEELVLFDRKTDDIIADPATIESLEDIADVHGWSPELTA